MAIARNQVNELLYQALETEIGGVKVYEAAVRCAVNDDLNKEWTEYLEQTQEHERVLREVFDALGLDQEADSPGRQVVRHIGESLVMAMTMARKERCAQGGGPVRRGGMRRVAETKDHTAWRRRCRATRRPGTAPWW